jgi:hypothetical protein
MEKSGLITEANRKWWTLGAMCLSMFMIMLGDFNPAALASGGPAAATNFTDALGAAMGLGAAVTIVGAVIAAVVIRGRPRHELAAHGGPELPRAAAFG